MCSKIRWPVRPLTVWGFWFLGGKARSFWLSPQPQGKKVGHLCEHLCFTSWEELKDSPTDKAKSPPSQVLSAAYLLLTSEVLWKKKLIIQWIFLSINKPFHSPLSEQKHPLLTPDTRPEELVCSPLNLSHWNCFREYNTLGDKKKKKGDVSSMLYSPASACTSDPVRAACWWAAHTETPRIREEHVIHVCSNFCIKDCAVNLRGSFSYFLRNWLLWLLPQNAVCLIQRGQDKRQLRHSSKRWVNVINPHQDRGRDGTQKAVPIKAFPSPRPEKQNMLCGFATGQIGKYF